jgi:hypothetical protein
VSPAARSVILSAGCASRTRSTTAVEGDPSQCSPASASQGIPCSHPTLVTARGSFYLEFNSWGPHPCRALCGRAGILTSDVDSELSWRLTPGGAALQRCGNCHCLQCGFSRCRLDGATGSGKDVTRKTKGQKAKSMSFRIGRNARRGTCFPITPSRPPCL